jgi:hypothetical protein
VLNRQIHRPVKDAKLAQLPQFYITGRLAFRCFLVVKPLKFRKKQAAFVHKKAACVAQSAQASRTLRIVFITSYENSCNWVHLLFVDVKPQGSFGSPAATIRSYFVMEKKPETFIAFP